MAQPQHEGLPDPFDRNDPRQVDAAARTLLRQFFTHNDSKSFELLVEVSLPILNGATEDVAREEGVAVGAQALLSPVFSELFVSMRPPVGLLDASFLSWAVARAREAARMHLAVSAGRKIPLVETDGEPHKPRPDRASRPRTEAGADSIVGRLVEASAAHGAIDLTPLGLSMSRIVEVVFHRLPAEHRRILRCVEVAHMTDAEAGPFLGIPAAEVQQRTAEARAELQREVHSVLDALGQALSCALQGEDLASLSTVELAAHLIDCETCTSNVELMHSLGDVPGWLKSVESNPGGASRVEQVLAAANARGTEELEQLLFEMFRACLSKVAEGRHVSFISPPRDTSELEQHARLIAQRGGRSLTTPSTSDALDAASRCTDLLRAVSPQSPKTRWAVASIAFEVGDSEAAFDGFNSIASQPDLPRSRRVAARVNMLWCLRRLQRYDEIVRLARGMIERGDAPKWASMYIIWAAAWTRDAGLFEVGAESFRAAEAEPEPASFWRELVDAEASWLAERLGLDRDTVLSTLEGDASC